MMEDYCNHINMKFADPSLNRFPFCNVFSCCLWPNKMWLGKATHVQMLPKRWCNKLKIFNLVIRSLWKHTAQFHHQNIFYFIDFRDYIVRPRLPDKLRQPNLAEGFLDNLVTNPPWVWSNHRFPCYRRGNLHTFNSVFFLQKCILTL